MFTPVQLANILSQPPYEPPVGQEVGTPVKMRVKDLVGVSGSPFKNEEKENYGQGELSKRVIRQRIAKNVSAGRCFSVVGFMSDNNTIKYTIDTTSGPPGGPHGELKALSKLPRKIDKRKILFVYIERKCCPLCHKKLKKYLDPITKIIYSCHYTPSKRQRAIEAAFQEEQSKLGIRIARKKTNPRVLFPK